MGQGIVWFGEERGSEFSGMWDPTKSNNVMVQIGARRCWSPFQDTNEKLTYVSVAVFPVAQTLQYLVKKRKR